MSDRELAMYLIFDQIGMAEYFETDEEEVRSAVETMTAEIEKLRESDSVVYYYLLHSVCDMDVNPVIWNNFFRLGEGDSLYMG